MERYNIEIIGRKVKMELFAIIIKLFSLGLEAKEQYQKFLDTKDEKYLKQLDGEIDYSHLEADLERYAEAVERYIETLKQETINGKLISQKERDEIIISFYESSDPKLRIRKEYVNKLINDYLDKVEVILQKKMTLGEKVLDYRLKGVDHSLEDVKNSNEIIQKNVNDILNMVSHETAKNETAINDVSGTLFELVDENYLQAREISDDKKGLFSDTYYNVNSDADIIFSVIVNNLNVHTKSYEALCQTLYDKTKTIGTLFLMANGGTGKTTLLCEIAVKACKEGFYDKVYYLKEAGREIRNNGLPQVDCNSQTLFLIDDAWSHSNTVDSLYKKYNQSNNVHIIFTDRIHKINSLLGDLGVPFWVSEGKGVLLRNSQNGKKIHTVLRERNVQEIYITEELRREISLRTINSVKDYSELDDEIATRALNQITLDNKSITDIVLDFCIIYNHMADSKDATIKRYKWDWDIWDEIPELKGYFKYIAAFIRYRLEVSTLLFEKITGEQETLCRAVEEGRLPIVFITNGVIRLRHDTVAENYFSVTNSSPFNVLYMLLEKNKLDEKSVVQFERRVLSLSNIVRPSKETEDLKIAELLQKFNSNYTYRTILKNKQRIHSLEFALIAQKLNASSEENLRNITRQSIGKSFMNVKAFYTNKLDLWVKYFLFSSRIVDHASIELMEFLKESPELYKKVTKIVNHYLRNNIRWLSGKEKKGLLTHAEDLFTWIIDNIDYKDVPSRIYLSWIYRQTGEHDKCIEELEILSNLPMKDRQINIELANIKLYEDEIKSVPKRSRNEASSKELIHLIITSYQNLLEECKEDKSKYTAVICSYVRFQKNIGNYNEAYECLMHWRCFCNDNDLEILEPQKIYLELGMICQVKGQGNKYYSLFESIRWLIKSCRAIVDESNERSKLYPLKPLARTLLSYGDYDNCLKACDFIEKIDPKDKEIPVIRIEVGRRRTIGKRTIDREKNPDYYQRLSRPQMDKKVEEMLGQMSEEQIALVNALDLKRKYSYEEQRIGVYRVIYSLCHNLPINDKYLQKLKLVNC